AAAITRLQQEINNPPPADIETAAEREARLAAEKAARDELIRLTTGRIMLDRNIGLMGEETISETPTGVIIRELDEIPPKIEFVTDAFKSMFGLVTMDAQTAID